MTDGVGRSKSLHLALTWTPTDEVETRLSKSSATERALTSTAADATMVRNCTPTSRSRMVSEKTECDRGYNGE